jgi:hypothetical protein
MDNKSIEELECDIWKDTEYPTELIRRSYELRKVPITNLDIDDLRLLIGQQIGLKYIVPLALRALSKDILAEGNYYPGDLLKSVLEIPKTFWVSNNSLFSELCSIVKKEVSLIRNSDIIDDSIKDLLLTQIHALK